MGRIIGQMPGGGKPLGRRHLLGGMVAMPVASVLLTPPVGDADLVTIYDRYTTLSRAMNYMESLVGVSPEEEERIVEAWYEECLKCREILLSASPQGPAGVAVLALTAIRQSEDTTCFRQWHHEWDGYSRPIEAIMSESNTILWNIAAWGLRQMKRA